MLNSFTIHYEDMKSLIGEAQDVIYHFPDDILLILSAEHLKQAQFAKILNEDRRTVWFWIHRHCIPRDHISFMTTYLWARKIEAAKKAANAKK